MKKMLIPVFVLALAPVAAAQSARAAIDAAQQAMGVATLTSIAFTANGALADSGEAAGGNAPHPVVKSYEAAMQFAPPVMRLRITRTNPDGTSLPSGSVENQYLSGAYVWDLPRDENTPPVFGAPGGNRGGGGGGGAPPGGRPGGGAGAPGAGLPGGGAPGGGPQGGGLDPAAFGGRGGPIPQEPAALIVRRMQIVLTPPGFLKAAAENNATVATQGRDTVVTFTTPQGQKYVGTLNAMNLVTKIATTNPARNNAPVEITFAMYRMFDGVRFPTRIVQTERREQVLDLTVTDVKANQAVALTVPAAVQGAGGPPASRGN